MSISRINLLANFIETMNKLKTNLAAALLVTSDAGI